MHAHLPPFSPPLITTYFYPRRLLPHFHKLNKGEGEEGEASTTMEGGREGRERASV